MAPRGRPFHSKMVNSKFGRRVRGSRDNAIMSMPTSCASTATPIARNDGLRSTRTLSANPPIYVFGASIGSAVAMDVAANREVRGLILHNPPPLRQIILRNYGWWNLWLLAGPVALQIPRELDS